MTLDDTIALTAMEYAAEAPSHRNSGGNDDDKPDYGVVSLMIKHLEAGSATAVLANTLRTDPILCYALMTDVGSYGAVPTKHITSCSQAIEVMGRTDLLEWLRGALKYTVEKIGLSETVRNALIRARFLELMGKTTMAREDTEDLYLVGLFSRLDRLLDVPLVELILPLPFSEELHSAILSNKGRIGRLLKFSETIESANESEMDFMQTNLRLPSAQVYNAYNEAYDWMKEVEEQHTPAA